MRKFQGPNVPHLELSLPGANGLGSEKSIIPEKSITTEAPTDLKFYYQWRSNFSSPEGENSMHIIKHPKTCQLKKITELGPRDWWRALSYDDFDFYEFFLDFALGLYRELVHRLSLALRTHLYATASFLV